MSCSSHIRRAAEALLAAGESPWHVAEALGIGCSTAYRWQREARLKPSPKQQGADDTAITPRPYPGARNLYGW